MSAPQGLIADSDGGEESYNKRFLETTTILGEGEFGQVKLVQDTISHKDVACKILRKGVVFKDNILYTPLKPNILRGEVDILRTLATKSYILQLIAVYESHRNIYIVTECCNGGDMNEWVSRLPDDLLIPDVQRITRQLFEAVSHCDEHHILHRDIKPANIMFTTDSRDSDLRLIDFGSGCKDASHGQKHTTFAGSAFFIAPEVFQRDYTALADVWSAAVTLYVLVAGYPSEELQKAFNILQKSKRDLRQLPGHVASLPDSYIDFLDCALKYFAADRPAAKELLSHEFLKPDSDQHKAVQIEGSVRRHTVFLDFTKFERSFTALLAALLSKEELSALVKESSVGVDEKDQNHLNVVPVADIKAMIGKIHPIVLDTVNAKLPSHFDGFSYHTALLNEFLELNRRNELVDERASNRSLRGSFRGLRRRQTAKRSSSIHGDVVKRNSDGI